MSKEKMKIDLEFTVLQSGQRTEYLDARNIVLIKDNSTFPTSDTTKRKFIMDLLLKKYHPRRGTPIDSTEKLTKQKDGTWIFEQRVPFTD